MKHVYIILLLSLLSVFCVSNLELREKEHFENINKGNIRICLFNSHFVFSKYYLTKIAKENIDSAQISFSKKLNQNTIDSSGFKNKMIQIDKNLTRIIVEELNNNINAYCTSNSISYLIDYKDTSLIYGTSLYQDFFKDSNGKIKKEFVQKLIQYANISTANETDGLIKYINKSENITLIKSLHETCLNLMK